MDSATQLSVRLRELFLEGRWIANTNYRELLSGLSLEQASRNIGPLNSIAALTFHVNYYLAGLLQVLRGGPLDIRDRFSFDLPTLQSEAEWLRLVDTLLSNAGQFAEEVGQMTDDQLAGPFVEEQYGTWGRNLEGHIEHSYYHMGQIALIRKLVSEEQG